MLLDLIRMLPVNWIILRNICFLGFLSNSILLKSIKLKLFSWFIVLPYKHWHKFNSLLLRSCNTVISLAEEERYSDVLQQARTAVEADRVKEELMNEISVGKGAVEETCILTVNKFILGTAHNHNMQITKNKKKHPVIVCMLFWYYHAEN